MVVDKFVVYFSFVTCSCGIRIILQRFTGNGSAPQIQGIVKDVILIHGGPSGNFFAWAVSRTCPNLRKMNS